MVHCLTVTLINFPLAGVRQEYTLKASTTSSFYTKQNKDKTKQNKIHAKNVDTKKIKVGEIQDKRENFRETKIVFFIIIK